jgi:alginate biosynthesis protein Alg44
VRVALLAIATALLIGFVADRIYERLFVIQVGGVSTVTPDGTPLKAIASGQIAFVNPAAKNGEPAFAIRSVSGEVLTVQMPCDCGTAPTAVKVGDTVFAGDTILEVAPTGAPLVVRASVGPDALRALVAGAQAQVRFPNGASVLASLDTKTARLAAPLPDAETQVALLPEATLDPSLTGMPVAVSVLTDPWKAIVSSSPFLAALVRNLGTLK